MSYVPLIAPSTTDSRIRFLASIADSFIYVVSKMGTTGASTSVSAGLSPLVQRIRGLLPRPIPLAVGFGVSTTEHFDEVGAVADGVVIGSQLVTVIQKSSGDVAAAVEAYCRKIKSGKGRTEAIATTYPPSQAPEPQTNGSADSKTPTEMPMRFGDFGGAYVPEALFDCLTELSSEYAKAKADPAFWQAFRDEFEYMNRPSKLYEATRLSEHFGGARIWLKREDLNHTGSHKINNAIVRVSSLVDRLRPGTWTR